MEVMIQNSLDENEKQRLLKEQWYHQRFDGCPYLLTFIALAETKREKRKGVGHAELRTGFFFNHRSDWYILEQDNKRTTNWFLGKSKEDSLFTKNLMKEWEESENQTLEMIKGIDAVDLSFLNTQELRQLHKKYLEVFVNAFSSSSIIDGFALGSDKVIADKIYNFLKQIGKEEGYNKIFSILTAPIHLSFENKAEISLLKIAEKCLEIEDWKNNEEIRKLLEQHQKNYFWIHNNYVDDIVLDYDFFLKELKQRLQKGTTKQDLQHLQDHSRKVMEEKQNLIKELNLPEDITSLLIYSEDFTKWQDDRKFRTFLNAHYSFKLLEEIGKRFGFSLEDLKMLTPPEIDLVFEKKIDKEEIERRKKGMMIIWRNEEFKVITNALANEMHDEFTHLEMPENLKEIQGLCASVGSVKGKVKVVKSAKEIHKVENGDILVAVMTRPDYVIGMRKAAAIVTDEGGITCHAAIVARELKIPCVIGTKLATRALKDGDLIEVNADKGRVMILPNP